MNLIRRQYDADGFYFTVNVMSESAALAHRDRLTRIESSHGKMHYRVKPYLICRSAYEIATSSILLDAVGLLDVVVQRLGG